MPDERIDKALKDPGFLALEPDDQVAVLQHYKDNPAAVAAPQDQTGMGLGPPPKVDEGLGTKLARGAELGTAAGLGIPESTSPKEVVGGAVKNAGKGYWEAAKSAAGAGDTGQLTSPTSLARMTMGPLGPTVVNVLDSVGGAGREAWKGLKDKDPEAFAHGFMNMATQVLTLAAMRRGKLGEAKIEPGMRQARLSTAIGAGAEEHLALEKAMPQIVEQAKSAGVHSVQDLGKVIKEGHTAVNDKFDRGFAPIAQQHYLPVEISRAVRNLVTPDMMKDYRTVARAKEMAKAHAEARAAAANKPPAPAPRMAMDPWASAPPPEPPPPAAVRTPTPKPAPIQVSDAMRKNYNAVVEIERQAREYEHPWTLRELNARRMSMNEDLASHYKKASMGQNADPITAHIKEAVRDKAADIVYKKWGEANPGQDAAALKQQHGALWKLDDAINGDKGATNTLKAKQGEYRAEGGRMGQLRGGANISKTGVHGYLANVADAMFGGGGPMQRANTKVRKAFNPSLTNRAAKLGVLGFPAAHQLSPPPEYDEQ